MNTIKAKNLTWIDIKDPRNKDLKWLKEKFNLHPLILKELLPPLDYPKVETFDNYLFVVLFYPFFDKKTSTSKPLELDIIASKDWLITSHYKDIVPLKAIFDKCNLYDEIKEEYLDEGPSEPLYRIINEILLACFPKLSHIKHNIDAIEKAVFEKKYQKTVEQISLVERDIIGFQRIIEPHKLLLEDLSTKAPKIFNKKIIPYIQDLKSLYNQLNSVLNTHHKTLNALTAMNNSLLTTRTNTIIKLLTIFSVIVFPLTLLAAIFGMNTTYLPFVGKPNDFWVISTIMLASAFLMLIFFKIKKWI